MTPNVRGVAKVEWLGPTLSVPIAEGQMQDPDVLP